MILPWPGASEDSGGIAKCKTTRSTGEQPWGVLPLPAPRRRVPRRFRACVRTNRRGRRAVGHDPAQRADRHDQAGALQPVRRAHRRRDLRRHLGRPRFQGRQRRRHPAKLVEHVKQLGHVVVRWPGGCFADKYHWRDGIGPRASAAAPLRPLARGDRVEPVRHARVHPLLPALRGRALSRGQRRDRLARRIPAVGRVLQRAGGLDFARRRARGQRRSANRSASATGASATRAGAAAASSFPKTTAASTASSPTGCRNTACRST